MNNIACPYEDGEKWTPPEESIKAAAYFGRNEAGEPVAEIKIPSAPCAYIRANYSINKEDMR